MIRREQIERAEEEKDQKSLERCLRSLFYKEMEFCHLEIRPAAENTCKWLDEDAIFQSWSAHQVGLLWISGKPGAGKSTAMKYALDAALHDTSFDNSGPIIVSFFFHGRGSEIQKSAQGFYRSMLYQLLTQAKIAPRKLMEAFNKNCEAKGEPHDQWEWHLEELRSQFRCAILEVLQSRAVKVFVDALDEAGEDTAIELVKEFQKLLTEIPSGEISTFGICFACRHYPILNITQGAEICVEKNNCNDISTCVRHKLGEDKPILLGLIRENSSGIFSWARLVSEKVERMRRERRSDHVMEQEIKKTPKELSEVYRNLLIFDSDEDREQTLTLIQ